MKYRVVITDNALSDVEAFLDYLIDDQQSPLIAKRWWKKALAKVSTLTTFPHRCLLPPENALRDYTIRALGVDSHLFLYRVDDDKLLVEVFGFRHGSRLPRSENLPKDS